MERGSQLGSLEAIALKFVEQHSRPLSTALTLAVAWVLTGFTPIQPNDFGLQGLDLSGQQGRAKIVLGDNGYDVELTEGESIPKSDLFIYCWDEKNEGPIYFQAPTHREQIEEACALVTPMVQIYDAN